jgi:hypothetical protein
MLRQLSTALVLGLMLTTGALAETDHGHGAKHGGLVAATTGHHNVELVAADGLLQVYLTDHDGGPEDVKGAKATATVLSGGKTEQVTLMPDAGNFLKGSGDFKAGAGTVVVITLTMPDHKPEQARFKLD